MTGDYLEIHCPQCGQQTLCGLTRQIELIRQAGMLRREKDADEGLLEALFPVALERTSCSKCGSLGLTAQPCSDDDAWDDDPPRRDCLSCGRPIPSERLEIFPDAQQCTACKEKGASLSPALHQDDFCPKCGGLMVVRQSARGGIQRYTMACSEGCR